MTTPTTAAPEYRVILLGKILPSQTKIQAMRRAHFTPDEMKEFAESLKIDGVLQPALVRPITAEMRAAWQLAKRIKPEAPVEYELVYGERRYLGSELAGLPTLPCHVRELTDAQVLRIQLVENLQRKGLHPLDEAEGYRAMRDDLKMTIPEIVKEIGKSREYIYARIKLCTLKGKAHKALQEGKLDITVAVAIARIPSEALQDKALEDVTDPYEVQTTDEALDLIRRDYMLDLKKASFDVKTVYFDTALKVSKGTAIELNPCETCPKRAANMPDLVAELTKGQDLCTDSVCFDAKREAHATVARQAAEKAGKKVITGAEAKKAMPWESVGASRMSGYISEQDVKSFYAGGGKTINLAAKLGKDLPEPVLIENPYDKSLVTAYPEAALQAAAKQKGVLTNAPSKAQADQNAKQREAEKRARLKTKINFAVLKQIIARPPLDRDALLTIANNYFKCLGHDNGKRLFEVYGWDFKGMGWNTKIDKFIKDFTGAEIGGFLVSCSLIADAHFNSYSSGEPDLLIAAAKRAGVDYTGIKSSMQAEAKEKAKPKAAKKKTAPPAAKKPAQASVAKKPAPTKKAITKRPNADFMAPVQPSALLAAVIGDKAVPRTEITSKVWQYIKKNDLQNKVNKHNIDADEKLAAVFGGKKTVSMFEMTKFISAQCSRAKPAQAAKPAAAKKEAVEIAKGAAIAESAQALRKGIAATPPASAKASPAAASPFPFPKAAEVVKQAQAADA